jgi:hypothetical protein
MKLSGTLLVCASAIVLSAVASAQCKDPWVSQAVQSVTGHPAKTTTSYDGDCNINNYGGGRWTSYPDLVSKVQAHFPRPAPAAAAAASAPGQCHDAWVTQAVTQASGHAPRTTTSYDGDCNINNYGGGRWSSYPDLVVKAQAYFSPRSAPAPVRPTAAPYPALAARPVPLPALAPRPASVVGVNGSAIVSSGAGNARAPIVASGAGNYRPAPIVASGAGNIYAASAGNVVAMGNYRGSDELKLADQGDPQAMYHVGMAHAADGPTQDLPEAYKWLSLAASHGVADAADERKSVREKLTPEQVKEINEAVKNWKPAEKAADQK